MKRDIDIVKKGDTLAAVVVNRKKCYIDIDSLTYDETIEFKKHFKIVVVDDLQLKLEQLQNLV
jgi:hypothetical protein